MKRKEFVVIGLGRFGGNVALTLESYGHTVMGIDSNPDIVQQYANQLSQAVILDSTSSEALKEVDIASFDTVIVAIGSDFEANLLTTVSLKDLGVREVICKAPTARQQSILLKVGADRVIRPEHEAGKRLADMLTAPSLLQQFELGPDTDYRIAEFIAPTAVACQSLKQSNMRQRYGLNVLIVKRGSQVMISPPAETIIQPQDILIVLGHDDEIKRFSEL